MRVGHCPPPAFLERAISGGVDQGESHRVPCRGLQRWFHCGLLLETCSGWFQWCLHMAGVPARGRMVLLRSHMHKPRLFQARLHELHHLDQHHDRTRNFQRHRVTPNEHYNPASYQYTCCCIEISSLWRSRIAPNVLISSLVSSRVAMQCS